MRQHHCIVKYKTGQSRNHNYLITYYLFLLSCGREWTLPSEAGRPKVFLAWRPCQRFIRLGYVRYLGQVQTPETSKPQCQEPEYAPCPLGPVQTPWPCALPSSQPPQQVPPSSKSKRPPLTRVLAAVAVPVAPVAPGDGPCACITLSSLTHSHHQLTITQRLGLHCSDSTVTTPHPHYIHSALPQPLLSLSHTLLLAAAQGIPQPLPDYFWLSSDVRRIASTAAPVAPPLSTPTPRATLSNLLATFIIQILQLVFYNYVKLINYFIYLTHYPFPQFRFYR